MEDITKDNIYDIANQYKEIVSKLNKFLEANAVEMATYTDREGMISSNKIVALDCNGHCHKCEHCIILEGQINNKKFGTFTAYYCMKAKLV